MRTANFDLSCVIEDCHVLDCNPLAVALELNDRPTSIRGQSVFPDQARRELLERMSGAER